MNGLWLLLGLSVVAVIITVIFMAAQGRGMASRENRQFMFMVLAPLVLVEIVGGLAVFSLAGDAGESAGARCAAGVLGIVLCGFCLAQIAMII
jgi:hypothetical protein